MLQPTEAQSLIQDLVYARKAASGISDPRIIDEMNCHAEDIYLKALVGIVARLMCKEMYWKCIKDVMDV